MEIEEMIQDILETLLKKLGLSYSKIEFSEDDRGTKLINICSDNPSLLIGRKGENIQALQHLLKILSWKKAKNEQFFISLDIENYREKQEENAINLAERKVHLARRIGRPQKLPPMSPALRRKIHLHLMGPEFDDIETFSEGEAENRYIVIKLKN